MSTFAQRYFLFWIMKGDTYLQLPDTFRSCFGIAVSPGNLVAAVVRFIVYNLFFCIIDVKKNTTDAFAFVP